MSFIYFKLLNNTNVRLRLGFVYPGLCDAHVVNSTSDISKSWRNIMLNCGRVDFLLYILIHPVNISLGP
jgi:hypothetical protein